MWLVVGLLTFLKSDFSEMFLLQSLKPPAPPAVVLLEPAPPLLLPPPPPLLLPLLLLLLLLLVFAAAAAAAAAADGEEPPLKKLDASPRQIGQVRFDWKRGREKKYFSHLFSSIL